MQIRKAIPVLSLCALLLACGGGGNNTNQTPPAQTLQAEIDQMLPFVANAPFDVAFSCERVNSQLSYDPFGFVVRGGIFRQRDIHVTGTTNPNATRGYGIFGAQGQFHEWRSAAQRRTATALGGPCNRR